jgi:hypothetical protein
VGSLRGGVRRSLTPLTVSTLVFMVSVNLQYFSDSISDTNDVEELRGAFPWSEYHHLVAVNTVET